MYPESERELTEICEIYLNLQNVPVTAHSLIKCSLTKTVWKPATKRVNLRIFILHYTNSLIIVIIIIIIIIFKPTSTKPQARKLKLTIIII